MTRPGDSQDEANRETVDLGVRGMEDAVEIGRGGFAVVYRARQPELNRTVAIKMLSTRLDEAGREQFAREGWAMGALSAHPNIVSVFGTGTAASGRPYIAMAYLREGSLADRLDIDGPLPWAEAVRMAIKLASALETAHRAGTLHRDVKPENVLLSDYGEPELTDFGIARVEGRYETATGQVAVSAAHASPEVLEGRSASVGSDVYSLGSTLFSLLAGRAAFARRPDETLMALYLRIARDRVPDLRPRGVPDAVCRVVEQAMDKDPGRRQTSAAELGDQLQEVQRRAGLPVTEMALALPATAARRDRVEAAPRSDDAELGETDDSERPASPPRRPRWPATIAVAVVLSALVTGALVVARGDGDERPVVSGPGAQPTTTVTTQAPPLALPAVGTGTEPTSVAVNPRTNRLYVANSGSLNVTVIDGESRQVLATVPMSTRPQSVAVNQRSGRVYVATAESSVVVISGDSNEVVGTIPLTSRPGGLAIDHRTDRVFVATSDPVLAVVDGPSSRVIANIPLAARPWSVAVIPETNRIFVTSQDAGTLSIIDGASYAVLATVPVGPRPCGVATNPRSRRVYVTSLDAGTVTVVDADVNTVVTTITVGSKPCGVTVNSQSSRVYATHNEAGTISVLDGNANEVLRARDVFRPAVAAEPLPYGVEVNPQVDGVYIVDREANRLLTLTGDELSA
ncbi:MAG: serine/threonine-protein kinase [Actinomycetota bacterium]|nr:serine/threonine-protein kinase [Actinomycetota bacterium]